jgi:hypothetical protein
VARIIFKCPYLKAGAASRRGNYVRYIATRDGAERIPDGKRELPVTFEQKRLIERLLKDFPDATDAFEYEDFLAKPTRGNASEFIAAALDANASQIGRRQSYVEYIARRPRAERVSHAHALFGVEGESAVLSRIADEAAAHGGNVWLPIISLRREDAERLGYDSAAAWRGLLRSFAPELAASFKIAPERFRWYAAYHDEGSHPHVHMLVWSSDPCEGFLSKQGIRQAKSRLAARVFRDELLHVYERQTQARSELGERSRERIAELVTAMQYGELQNERIEQLVLQLSARLRKHKGKKQYGYLQSADKRLVDEIADELCADDRVAECYKPWCEARLEILRTYVKNPAPIGALSQQPELKRIRNIIIEEAAAATTTEAMPPNSELRNQSSESGEAATAEQRKKTVRETDSRAPALESIGTAADSHDSEFKTSGPGFGIATRLLRHVGNIFRENPPITERGSVMERKLLRKLRQKKIAQGHAEDECGQHQTY